MSRTRWPQDASKRDAAAPAGPPPRIRVSVVCDAKLLQRGIGTTVPSRDRSIADVLQVIDAHAGGPEAGGRQIAETGEERDAVRELRSGLRRPRDVIKHRRSLRLDAVEKHRVETQLAFVIEPGEAAAHRDLPRRLVDHHEVHELRY